MDQRLVMRRKEHWKRGAAMVVVEVLEGEDQEAELLEVGHHHSAGGNVELEGAGRRLVRLSDDDGDHLWLWLWRWGETRWSWFGGGGGYVSLVGLHAGRGGCAGCSEGIDQGSDV